MDAMKVEPVSRAHLKRTVQIKKEQEDTVKALHASFIAIDKKAKREDAKKKREAMKCYNMTDMFSALEEIESNQSILSIDSIQSMFTSLSV
jgi:hypothetical protein